MCVAIGLQHTYIHKNILTHTYIFIDRQTVRQTDRQTDRQING